MEGLVSSAEANAVQISERHRQSERIADRFMKARVGSVAEDERLSSVAQVVVDVAELVMQDAEVLLVDIDAHLQAYVCATRVNARRGRVAVDLAVIRCC